MCESKRVCLFSSSSASISLYSIKYPCEMIESLPVNAAPPQRPPQVASECFSFLLHISGGGNNNSKKKVWNPCTKETLLVDFVYTAMHTPHRSFAYIFIFRNLWNSNNGRATIKTEKQKERRGATERGRQTTIIYILNLHNYIHVWIFLFFRAPPQYSCLYNGIYVFVYIAAPLILLSAPFRI